jgi:hypothetical protein
MMLSGRLRVLERIEKREKDVRVLLDLDFFLV